MAEEEAAGGEDAPLPPHQVHVSGVACPDISPDLPGILVLVSQQNLRHLNTKTKSCSFLFVIVHHGERNIGFLRHSSLTNRPALCPNGGVDTSLCSTCIFSVDTYKCSSGPCGVVHSWAKLFRKVTIISYVQ